MASFNSLEELFQEQLQDLYDAEHQIVEALPKMAEKTNDKQLRTAFEKHLRESEQQIQRLERVFQAVGQEAERKTCKAMKGLIEEGQELLKARGSEEVIDAGLIGAAQRIEHYEIAGYGTARTLARQLGQEEAAQLLQETLDEEYKTDRLLSDIAESRVNQKASR
jgi:ferritin-like metal-binding protein YciE